MRWKAAMFLTLGAVALVGPSRVHGQTASPLSASARAQFAVVSRFVARSAEKIPETLYSFRATPEVRTIAQLFGHIANEYFAMCAAAAGTEPRRTGIEDTVTTRADLITALRDGAAYCASVMEAMNDQRGTEPVSFYFGPTPRLGVLHFVTTHTYEHYGNLVTYMRLNDIVPPSSETAAPPTGR